MAIIRYTAQDLCPICGGHPKLPQGQGTRCTGYFSDDRRFAYCSRETYAGTAQIYESAAHRVWRHWLGEGECKCGNGSHGQPSPVPSPSSNSKKSNKPSMLPVAEYDYKDADGHLVYQVVRVEPVTQTTPPTKDFLQRHPCPEKNGDWVWNLGGPQQDKCSCPKIDRQLYRLPELLAAEPGATVYPGEGEKDVDLLRSLGLVATCNSGGAGNNKWEDRYSDAFQGHPAVILPDNDQDGYDHGQRMAQSLHGKAKSVRVLDLPNQPDKGDVSDWLDSGRTVKELLELAANTEEWVPGDVLSEYSEAEAGTRTMRFLTAAEVAAIVPEDVDWISRPWVAKGSLTEADGKIKAAGKTTFLMAMCRKVLDGLDFMGEPTSKSPVVYLTEQPMTSLREALRRAGLLEREDFHLLPYQDTIGTPWPDVVMAAIRKCREVGAKLMVIDTLPQFAGLRGEGENSSGAALEALEPVQLAAREGIGVVVSRHDRKAGGDVGDSGRGSSAWGGVADIIISIRRGDGNTRDTVRHLHSLSRFDETPDKLVIELLENGEYVSLGTETKLAFQEAVENLWKAMPHNEGDALERKNLYEAAKCSKTNGQAIIKSWVEGRHLGKVGKGVSKDPEKFWKLDIGRSEAPGVVTNQVDGPANAPVNKSPKSRSVTYKDEVLTDQAPDAGTTASTNDVGAAAEPLVTAPKSRSVRTPTPISDQPSLDSGRF